MSKVPTERKEPAPLMLRASITRDEYTSIRTRAIKEGVATHELVAALIRRGLSHGRERA